MVAEPGLDGLVEFGDLLVQGHYLHCQRTHRFGSQLLPGQVGVLPFGGLDGSLSEPVSIDDVTVAQPCLQPPAADPSDGCGRPVAGQQGERAGVGQIQCTFQAGEDAGEPGAEPVDGSGAVGDQTGAAREDLEIGDGVVAAA
jgi:hypothetical protein